jgi:hypothetical protein
MPRTRSSLQTAVGQLILAIQKEEALVIGDGTLWAPAQAARENADDLYIHATTPAALRERLAGKSLSEYIGVQWLASHRSVRPALAVVLSELGSKI